MSTVPDAAELAMLSAGKQDWMQTAIVLCTKTPTVDAGGSTDVITEGATILGRRYDRTTTQALAGIGGAPAMFVALTQTYIEVPVAHVLTVTQLVRIGALYYEITEDTGAVDDATLLANSYRVVRADVTGAA